MRANSPSGGVARSHARAACAFSPQLAFGLAIIGELARRLNYIWDEVKFNDRDPFTATLLELRGYSRNTSP